MEPFVLRGHMNPSNYEPMKWNLKDFPNWLKKMPCKVRVGTKMDAPTDIQYEKTCLKVNFENAKMIKWFQGNAAVANLLPKKPTVHTGTHWGYLDYKTPGRYFKKKIARELKFTNQFKGLEAANKTDGSGQRFWLGTPGANTPCHYDSYGFNLHVQIAGVKRWIIFPPSDQMRPSRFPYEESTIYSRWNVVGGRVPEGSHPRVVDLKPGDVLFLPPKWWHCVIVLEDEESFAAFSVSRWYPIEADVVEKAKECAIHCLMSPLQHAAEDKNDLREVNEFSRRVPNIIRALIDYENRPNAGGDDGGDTNGEPATKRPRNSDSESPPPCPMASFYDKNRQSGEPIPILTPDELTARLAENNPFTPVDRPKLPLLTPDADYGWLAPDMDFTDWTSLLHTTFDAFTNDLTVNNAIQHLKRTVFSNPNPGLNNV